MGARLASNKRLREQNFPAQPNGAQAPGVDGKGFEGASSGPQFGLLGLTPEERRRRWLAMGFSPVLEIIVVSIMLWALMSLPPKPPPQKANEEVLYLHPPNPATPFKQPLRLLERPVERHSVVTAPSIPKLQRQESQKPAVADLKIPKISQPAIKLPIPPPKSQLAPTETFTATQLHHEAPEKQVAPIRTGAFSPGSMASGTVERPLRQVQTGGFGASNGIPNDPSADSHTRVAELGSFDLPPGAGHGNGAGGARGTRGIVGSAGFGNGIGNATGSRSNSAAQQSVRQGGFGSVVAGNKAPQNHSAIGVAPFKPVVVLSKPDPVYPPEARREHIEGQVILSVLFGASGKLRVLNVVEGLGHGMDEAAVQAAERITFTPAERDGKPVDFASLVHIIFQLAF